MRVKVQGQDMVNLGNPDFLLSLGESAGLRLSDPEHFQLGELQGVAEQS